MASPSVSAILSFVKKYPIVLCGFSLLSMPSVHRLLLYFTPLLLSTAIFIVAMMSWGPSTSSEKGRRRSKHKVGHAAWAFNKMDDEEEEDEEVEEEELVDMQQAETSQTGNPIKEYLQHEGISQKGKTSTAEPDPDLKLEAAELEPDPDLAEEGNRVGTASNEAITLQCGGQAQPDPDLQRDCARAACSSIQLGGQAEPDPDLQRDCVGAPCNSASAGPHAEPDPDLQEEQKAGPHLQLHYNCPALEHEHDPAPADHDLHPSAGAADLHAQLNHDQPAAAPHGQDHEESPDDHHQLHAGSDEEHVEGDLHEALRHKLGVIIRKAPYSTSDDPHDTELASYAAVERLEASLGISGSSSHQRAPEHRLQALHAAA